MNLTPREQEVLGLLIQGQTNKQIADQLRISHFTARDHVSALLRKSGVRRREELSAFARVGKRVLE